jgi:hypothetical protein
MTKRHRGSSPPFHEPEFDFDGFLPAREFAAEKSRGIQPTQDEEHTLQIQPLVQQDKPREESLIQKEETCERPLS